MVYVVYEVEDMNYVNFYGIYASKTLAREKARKLGVDYDEVDFERTFL